MRHIQKSIEAGAATHPAVAIDVGTAFSISTFPAFPPRHAAVLNYVATINKEYTKLEVAFNAVQEEVGNIQIIMDEQVRLRKRETALKRKKSRRANDEGGFITSTHTSTGITTHNQKRNAVKRVEQVIGEVADTPQKRMELLAALSPNDIEAKLTIADAVIDTVSLLYNIIFSPAQMMYGKLIPLFRWALFSCIPKRANWQALKNVREALDLPARSRYFTTATNQKRELTKALSGGDFVYLSEENKRAVICNVQIRAKKTRSDALTKKDILDIEAAWVANCEVSPNAADVRKVDNNGNTKTIPIHQFYNRIIDVRNYIIVHILKRFAISTVYIHKPWYIRKGKADTCMCHYCENIRLAQKATMDNYELLNRPTVTIRALYTLQKCCIRTRNRTRSKLNFLSAKGNTLSYAQLRIQQLLNVIPVDTRTEEDINIRYPTMTLVSMCRGAYKSKILDKMLCQNAIPAYRQLCVQDKGESKCIGHCNMEDECNTCKTKAKILRFEAVPDADVSMMEKICDSVSCAMQDKFWKPDDTITYCSWGDDTGENNTAECIEHVTAPVKFVDAFLNRLTKYAEHISTLRRSKFTALQEEHNMLLWRGLLDMDFSQNFNFGKVHRRAIQSAHWKNKSATIFTAVFRCLCSRTFLDLNSILIEGDEVSVYIAETDLYHYGTIKKDMGKNAYTVILLYDTILDKPPGKTHVFPRSMLRHRKILTIPIIVVSNDKHHDTAFVQHFLKNTFADWFRHHQQSSQQYTKDITEISIHSDGAASHFKNKDSIGYLITLRKDLKLKRAMWLFGCPGHGKGVWDGLGGIVKNGTAAHLVRLEKPINEVYEIFKIIKKLFAPDPENITDLDMNYQKKRSNLKCEPWHIKYVPYEETNPYRPSAADITREGRIPLKGCNEDANFSGNGAGTRSMFFFEAVGDGCQLVFRKYGCSCVHCVQSNTGLIGEPELRRTAGARSPMAMTIIPSIGKCVLQEPWLSQHLSMAVKSNPKNQAVIDEKTRKREQKAQEKAQNEELRAQERAQNEKLQVQRAKEEKNIIEMGLRDSDAIEKFAVVTGASQITGRTRRRNITLDDSNDICLCARRCNQCFQASNLHKCFESSCSNLVHRSHASAYWRCFVHNYLHHIKHR
jgi:hypothetical protein